MTAWQALGMGVGLGLGAGMTPGPLLGLVINETLRGGWRAGMLVALAPAVTDVAIILFCYLVLVRLPVLAFPLLSIAGGLYVMFLAWETLRVSGPATVAAITPSPSTRQSLVKGVLVNLLNPHPYLFWLTVGGPLITKSYQQSAVGSIAAFLSGFYGCLVGAKILVALLIHAGRVRLQGKSYGLALRLSAGVLLVFGVLLLWGGARTLSAR